MLIQTLQNFPSHPEVIRKICLQRIHRISWEITNEICYVTSNNIGPWILFYQDLFPPNKSVDEKFKKLKNRALALKHENQHFIFDKISDSGNKSENGNKSESGNKSDNGNKAQEPRSQLDFHTFLKKISTDLSECENTLKSQELMDPEKMKDIDSLKLYLSILTVFSLYILDHPSVVLKPSQDFFINYDKFYTNIMNSLDSIGQNLKPALKFSPVVSTIHFSVIAKNKYMNQIKLAEYTGDQSFMQSVYSLKSFFQNFTPVPFDPSIFKIFYLNTNSLEECDRACKARALFFRHLCDKIAGDLIVLTKGGGTVLKPSNDVLKLL